MNKELATAILLLKRDQALPLDLTFRLAARGYDVAALEARYSR